MRKRYFLFGFLMITLAACSGPGKLASGHDHSKYLPEGFRQLYFGITEEKALELRPRAQHIADETFDFRKIYTEPIENEGIKFAVYYFDNEGEKPLYETIFEFYSPEARDEVAQKLLGTPNHEEGEWMYYGGEGFMIHAWTFKNKLIIVGKLPGTEWE
jgi:hypothetical protein